MMTKWFSVLMEQKRIKVSSRFNLPLQRCLIYIDHQLRAVFFHDKSFYLDLSDNKEGRHHLTIIGEWISNGQPVMAAEQYTFEITNAAARTRARDFRPGDILVASDNVNELLTGYVGHSALVMDERTLIESPGGHPAIKRDTIQQFLEKHPEHAHFRPKSPEMGRKAVAYAENYLTNYQKALNTGGQAPVFSYNLSASLEDPWEYIYCSKLIWLSYFHGADYKMENDYLWFSPEDLYTYLMDNENFELLYKHDNVKFNLNT